MGRCLICQRTRSDEGVRCKLCGMHTERPVRYRTFSFCCRKCVDYFRNIVSNTPGYKLKAVLGKNPVI